ncbi:MAG: TIGR01777 family oxidoreductase [Thermodesulfobacteriota bacterium]
MRIFVVGGTGFIGSHLLPRLLHDGHEVRALIRSPRKAARLPDGVAAVAGDPSQPGPWQEEVRQAGAVINLAGFNIFARWTAKNRALIRDSRIRSTRHIVEAISADISSQAPVLISASAVGYFGFDDGTDKGEDAPAGDDFLARVCVDWEKEAFKACHKGARVITARIGIVLGADGGALTRMLPAFRLGVAGRLGNGRQWFPWIHINDLVAILSFCLDHAEINGPVNCCAPSPVTNREFTRTLSRVLRRPAILPVPGWVVRLALGELSAVVLKSPRMVPAVLMKHRFPFRYPELEPALCELLRP